MLVEVGCFAPRVAIVDHLGLIDRHGTRAELVDGFAASGTTTLSGRKVYTHATPEAGLLVVEEQVNPLRV